MNAGPSTEARGRALVAELGFSGVHVARRDPTPAQRGVVCLALLASFVVGTESICRDPTVLLYLPAVVLLIDFLSGFVHWLFDNRIDPGPTFFGRMAVDFLDHHVRPQRTVDVSFSVSAFRPALFVTLPLLAVSIVLSEGTGHALVFWIGALALFVPQTHKYAHRNDCSALVRALQSSRIVLNPRAHGQHHRNNEQAYCVFTGWLNPVLDTSGFWRRMDHIIDRLEHP